MIIDIVIPSLGESVNEGVIARWLKPDGAFVQTDEIVLELETDKAAMELPAPVAGRLSIKVAAGVTVKVGQVVGSIDSAAVGDASQASTGLTSVSAHSQATPSGKAAASAKPETTPVMLPQPGPAARKLLQETAVNPASIAGSGKDGRITKADVLAATAGTTVVASAAPAVATGTDGDIERVPMTRLRQRIAERLLQAQRGAAILTTFNEIDMSAVKKLRADYNQAFEKKYGVKLGLMSLFGMACIQALKDIREVNAQIDGTDIVYYKRVHLGIAVGSERGLVVPIIRNADLLTLAQLEKAIAAAAQKARNNKLMPDDLAGGTFTISNGGVYGSLLSTPILNPPQTGILGMHKIEDRPVVVAGQIVVRPMMYVALSYDHRLIDGEQAVTFLVKVKNAIEDPQRMLLGV